MSWTEVKKINSDLNSPLDHLIWLNDYKTFGDSSYVKLDERKYNALLADYNLSMNDTLVMSEALSYAINNNEIGAALYFYQLFEGKETMHGKVSPLDIISDWASFEALCANSTLYQMCYDNETFNAALNTEESIAFMQSAGTDQTWISNVLGNVNAWNLIKKQGSAVELYTALCNSESMLQWMCANENIYSVLLKDTTFCDVLNANETAAEYVATTLSEYILTNGTTKTITGSQTYNCSTTEFVKTITAGIGSKQETYNAPDGMSGGTVYAFARAGASYINIDSTSVTVQTVAGAGGDSYGGPSGSSSSGTTSQPYTSTTVSVGAGVKSVTLVNHSYTHTITYYNATATATASAVIASLPIK